MAEPPPLFASMEPPTRRRGLSPWFAVAFGLVVGILIGFASGYRVGLTENLESAKATDPAPTGPETVAPSSQTFSESPVAEPAPLNPDPVVAPAPAPTPPSPRVTTERPAPPRTAPAEPAPRRTAARPAPPRTAPAEPAPSGPGAVEVLSRPAGAQIILDGQLVGRTPLTIPDVTAGAHTIRLDLPDFKRWETTVDVKPGVTMKVAASLEQ
jgi:hypothetical protein